MKNFVINLKRQPEKYESFLKLNAGTRIAFERFEASDGASFSPQDALEMKLVVPGAQFTPGAIGCAASHFRIWQETAQSEAPALVFEDDAIIRNDINERLDLLLRALKEWDYVALGYNMDSILDLDLAPGMRSMMMFLPKYPDDESARAYQKSTSHVAALRLVNYFGTPGYVVSPAGARKLLRLCFPMENRFVSVPALNRTLTVTGVDGMMNCIYQSIEAFACFAPLVVPKNDRANSTVQNGAVQRW